MVKKREWLSRLPARAAEKNAKASALRKRVRMLRRRPLSDYGGLQFMMRDIFARNGIKYRPNFTGKEWEPCREDITRATFSYVLSMPAEDALEVAEKLKSCKLSDVAQWLRDKGSTSPEADAKNLVAESKKRYNEMHNQSVAQLNKAIARLSGKMYSGRISEAEKRDLFLLTNLRDALGHTFIALAYLEVLQ